MQKDLHLSQTNKKFCSSAHIKRLTYYCKECKMYICEDCTEVAHISHFNQLISVLSLAQEKLSKYTDLTVKAKLMRRIAVPEDEIKNQIFKQITNAYENFMQNVIEYKDIFIQKSFKQLFPQDEIKDFHNLPQKENLTAFLDKIDEIHGKMKEYCNQKETNIEEIMKLEEPHVLSSLLENLAVQNRELREFQKTKFEYKFDEDTIDSLFRFEFSKMRENYIERESLESRLVAQLTNSAGGVRIYDLIDRRGKVVNINKERFPNCAATCTLKDRVYVAGSNKNKETDAYFFEVDGVRESYQELSRMIDRRSSFCLIAVSPNELYAIGGFDYAKKYGSNSLVKCERYIIKDNKWEPLPPLNEGRYNHGSCYFPETNEVYTFGGIVSSTNMPTDSIERFNVGDPLHWTTIMHRQRATWKSTFCIICKAISNRQILIAGTANFIFDVKNESMIPLDKPPNTKELYNYVVSPTTYKGKIYCFNNTNQHVILEYLVEHNVWNVITC